ncbi:MAG: FHA domain-containing protein [Ruminococcus sp.]|nr:FHA domain-containing protein [Ruminococcus sp.]
MNVIKCSNGHFFDGDSYQVCPHCGASAGGVTPAPSASTKEKKKGIFGRKNKEPSYNPQQMPVNQYNPVNSQPVQQYNAAYNGFGDGNSPTVDMPQEPAASQAPKPKKEVTLDFWQTTLSSNPNPQSEQPAASEQPSEQAVKEETVGAAVQTPVYSEHQVQNEAERKESLLDKVRSASANTEGKTMSYFSAVTNEAKTDSTGSSNNAPIDPVVGWLVCTHGSHFGESFIIVAGMNSIGRNNTNRIVLDKDPSVSREKHALITYEPKHRRFYVKPGDSSGLTYINEEYITETKQIKEKDVIELGNSKFIFVPLCGEDFTWEDYMKGH